jgi:hypothetical protein
VFREPTRSRHDYALAEGDKSAAEWAAEAEAAAAKAAEATAAAAATNARIAEVEARIAELELAERAATRARLHADAEAVWGRDWKSRPAKGVEV